MATLDLRPQAAVAGTAGVAPASSAEIVAQLSALEVLVVGDAMIDTYLEGSVDRLCREAPVPIVAVRRQTDAPGGAANTAVNLRALGARVHLVAPIGDDDEGWRLIRSLQAHDTPAGSLVICPHRETLAKERVVAGAQLLLRFDRGRKEPMDPATERRAIAAIEERYPHCDAVVISDYDYGALTPAIIDTLRRLVAADPRVLVVDAKCVSNYRDLHPSAVKPNYREAVALLGLPVLEGPERAAQLQPYGPQLLDLTGAGVVAVTLDADGALVFQEGHDARRTYATGHPDNQAAGAGDTYVSALTLALAAGAQAPLAADIAAAAAAVVVEKPGTSSCCAAELVAHLSTSKLADDLTILAARAEAYRRTGRRIVLANGCFDLLHAGHIAFLHHARSLGDALVVAVNSDAGVRRLKGPGRPFNSERDRVELLSALSCVDDVVVFDQDTAEQVVRAVRPDLFVKGQNYHVDDIPEAEVVQALGGRVEVLPYVRDHSTTDIIHRIQEHAV